MQKNVDYWLEKIHTNFNAKINTVKVDFFVGFSNTVGINSK